jgi:hypothetical protein
MMRSNNTFTKDRSMPSGRRRMIGIAFAAMLALLTGCSSDSSDSAALGASTGLSGSQARFAIVGDYLYAVNSSDLQVFDITTPSDPAPWSSQSIGFGIETIFSNDQYLFIGSQIGHYIYDVSAPAFPHQISQLLHAQSCDPVVVEGNYAYVTLRSGNTMCGGNSNQLDIIDISTVSQPMLIKSYAMQQPSGLGVDNGTVFVCDGIAGLKVLDVTDPLNIQPLDSVGTQNCYDVIPVSGHLVVSGLDGLYQYDYMSFPMTELSKL